MELAIKENQVFKEAYKEHYKWKHRADELLYSSTLKRKLWIKFKTKYKIMDLQRIKKIFFQQNGILAWIVCLGMLISNSIVQGINNAFGEIIPAVIKEFDSDIATVSLIPSIDDEFQYRIQ